MPMRANPLSVHCDSLMSDRLKPQEERVIPVVRLRSGVYVCHGNAWASLERLMEHVRSFHSPCSFMVTDADLHTNTFWQGDIDRGKVVVHRK